MSRMHSMTGFGAAQSGSPFFLHVSIRSVNGRFLETRFHLGREFFELESDLKKLLSEQVERGTVDIYISKKTRAKGQRKVAVDAALAKAFMDSVQKTSKRLRLKQQDVSIRDILRLPGVVEIEDQWSSSEAEKKALLSTFRKALQSFVREKKREGTALQKILLKQLLGLQKLVRELESLRVEANRGLEKRLRDRLAQRSDEPVEPSRVAQELIYYLDRSDVDEEIARLGEHLKTCQSLLKSDKKEESKIGKKLDFFAQELLREINTIGSKANLADMTRKVVEAKTLVESFREQVQNIE